MVIHTISCFYKILPIHYSFLLKKIIEVLFFYLSTPPKYEWERGKETLLLKYQSTLPCLQSC